MGLDASVMCHCFRDGKTKPPPFPREWLEMDSEGQLNLKSEFDTDDRWGQHYQWRESCCEHAGMNFACEHISNWSGYRQFQEALGEVGWQYFPVLKEQLPHANGGLTPPHASAQAVEELNVFTASNEIGVNTVLVNTATGDSLYEYVAAYGGVFIFSQKLRAGLSDCGFFAVDQSTGESLFRARRFRQYDKSGKKLSDKSEGLVWENLDTGEIYESGIAISGKQIPWEDGRWQKPDGTCRWEYPAEFHIEQRPSLASDFKDIVTALKAVFQASVVTGNPVRWS